jgi:trigger factor
MKVSVEKQPNSMVKLTIEVEAALFNHGLDHAFEEEVKQVEVKGFRKGKVPRATFEKMFGIERLYEKAINHTINHTYGDALDQSNITPVAPPHIDVDMDNLGKDKPMTYFVDVAVKPEVTLGDVEGIKVTMVDNAILDGDVDAELEHRLSHKAELNPKQGDTLALGDTAIFDFTGYLNGEEFEGGKAQNHQLKIGSGQFIPGFEDGMIGLKIGETRDVNVTFPAEYQAENLAGQPVVFKVVLHEIKETKLPELTTELIQELSKNATTKDEWLAELRLEMETKHKEQAKNQLIDSVVRQAATTATVDIPHDMIHAEMDRLMEDVTRQAKQYNIELEMFLQFQGTTLEQYKHDLHQRAEDQLRYSLVLEEIATSRNLKPSEQKIADTYADIAKQYNMELDKVKEALTVEGLTEQLKTQLAVDYLVEHIKS